MCAPRAQVGDGMAAAATGLASPVRAHHTNQPDMLLWQPVLPDNQTGLARCGWENTDSHVPGSRKNPYYR